MSKVWVYVSEKHDPEVYRDYSKALESIIADSRCSLEELIDEGYADGSEESGTFYVEDIGYLVEVGFDE